MNTKRLIWVLAIAALAVFFSFYKLTESPSFWYDEGWYVQTSSNLATLGVDGVQLAPGYVQHVSSLTVGYPLIYPMGLWLRIFGTSAAAARSLMALFILGFLATGYFAVKKPYGSTAAVVAFALLATFPPLYGNGKSVLGEVPGMLYLGLFLILFGLGRTSSTRKAFWFMLAGISAGLCVATKPMFLLLLPALAVGAFVEWRRKSMSLKQVGIGVACLLVPVLVWLVVQFHGGTDSASVILSFYANPYHENSLIHVLLSNIRRIFTDTSTLYTMFILGVWSAAMGFRWWSKEARAAISGEEVIAWVFSILVFLAFLRIGSVYRYLFPAQTLALLFFWPSIKALLPRARYAAIGITVLIGILGLYQLMFSSWVADSYGSQKTAFWQEYFSALPAQTSVFFYDTPEVVPFIHGRDYSQFIDTPAYHPTGQEELAVLRSGSPDMVIATDANYQAASTTLFAKYAVQKEAYKYSILTPSSRSR